MSPGGIENVFCTNIKLFEVSLGLIISFGVSLRFLFGVLLYAIRVVFICWS